MRWKLLIFAVIGIALFLLLGAANNLISESLIPIVGGRVEVQGDPKAATACALKAQSEGRPFRVRYDIMGYDSAVAGGIVRASTGQIYGLSFVGDPSGHGGISLFRQRVNKTPCPQPTHLWVNPKGRINCFQQQLSPPAGLMSPNFEPY
jgi:hypothetical protein